MKTRIKVYAVSLGKTINPYGNGEDAFQLPIFPSVKEAKLWLMNRTEKEDMMIEEILLVRGNPIEIVFPKQPKFIDNTNYYSNKI